MSAGPAVVAVVGRPNVGKSTLVNRIVGRQVVIVEDEPGVTRDRKELEADWLGIPFTVVDTGGWLPGGTDLEAKVSRQVEQAVVAADVVLLVVDASVGVTEEDADVAEWLRRTAKEVLLVANKADNDRREAESWELLALGMGEPWPVSALHGRRTGDLLDEVVARFPDDKRRPIEADDAASGGGESVLPDVPAVAVVGRPNVGKSTLFNRLIGEDRAVVHDMPGTTRDSVDTVVETEEVNPLESTLNNNNTTEQQTTIGPVASLESIKLLGSNGGGFFVSNSAHPFENPTGLSNIYEIFLMLIIPLSFPIAYAKLIGLGRGISILITMLIGFGVLLSFSLTSENGPQLLETRVGSFGSALFDTTSLGTNTGAVNSALAGMSSNAVTSFFLAMFVQAIPGAVGTGMMTMIVYVLLTLFIVGLMVGKTPEFMSMKISPKDIKLAIFIFLLHPAIILIPTVIAFTTGNAQQIVGEQVTSMGFTQTLYEYTSSAANNGSAYFGTSADTPFWNWSTAIVMFLGRFVPLGLMLAIAGSFTVKDRKEVVEPIKTQGPLFISVLVVMTFLLAALSFFPFLVMGPISI